MPEAVIISCARSPMGRAGKGAFSRTRMDDIAEQILREAIRRAPGVDPGAIEDVLVGCAMPEGEQGLNVARNISLLAGIPVTAGAATINRFCASSLEAIATASRAAACGDGDLFVAGGVETMTNVPMGGFNPSLNGRLMRDGSPDAYISMGLTAENLAREYSIAREEQDRFALMSHRKAVSAQARGRFDSEIAPVLATGQDGRRAEVSRDEGPRADTSMEALAALRPAFLDGGTVTAGNSSPLSDGAAMLVISSDRFAKKRGMKPLARIRSIAVAGVSPEVMGTGPIHAVPKALRRARMKPSDVDLIELNEAFAAQAIAVMRELGLDEQRVNIHGGALALGHPLGMSGARIVTTLLHAMVQEDAGTGLAAMCVGGGQGMALIVERT
jgi:acetyl-CoA acetyltransferase family protein